MDIKLFRLVKCEDLTERGLKRLEEFLIKLRLLRPTKCKDLAWGVKEARGVLHIDEVTLAS